MLNNFKNFLSGKEKSYYDINYLRKMHFYEKKRFESRIHLLHPKQIFLEKVLLNLEESAYFKRGKLYTYNFYECEKRSKQRISDESGLYQKPKELINCQTKPYKCELPECEREYTSAHGLKYHKERGHVKKEEVKKPYVCQIAGCDKKYKNANGLKYHSEHGH